MKRFGMFLCLVMLTMLTMLTTQTGYSQQCNCLSNLEWMKKTIEENDAGYQYAIDKKGDIPYALHNEFYFKQAKTITSRDSCENILNQWLRFFRKGHLGVGQNRPQTSEEKIDTAAIIQQFKNTDSLKIALPAFEKYLLSKQTQDYEGIWTTSGYKIGVKKAGNEYLGFIIEGDGVYWRKGQIKMRISEKGGTWYKYYHTIEKDANVKLVGNNHLEINDIILTRISPALPDEPWETLAYKLKDAHQPFIEQRDSNTLILRVHSFDIAYKKAIDSVIRVNREKILHTENLIIDLRFNGGGIDDCYKEILPFIYTNPYRVVNSAYKSTPLNNELLKSLYTSPRFASLSEASKQWAKRSYDSLQQHPGAFIQLAPTKVDIDQFDTVYPYPKNVGIIIDKWNGSTAEQFLMAAKQSWKVKLFGTSTYGSQDISNLNEVNSPSGEFRLYYSISKSFRLPDMVLDPDGLQPDFFIDNSIPWYKWVDYTSEILHTRK